MNKTESSPSIKSSPESTTPSQEIASHGNFSAIRSELLERNILAVEKERVRLKYEKDLSKINFLTEQDLEVFTILDLYDEELAIHSLETYSIAKEKVEKSLAFDVVLLDLFHKEGVSPVQFFRACLLHDIGKVEIPSFIINNSVNNEEMNLYLRELVINDKDNYVLHKLEKQIGENITIDEISDLETILEKYNLRSVHFVPVKHILSETEQNILRERGFDLNSSIMDIIKTHEEFSEQILASLNLPIESSLAGSHHNYHGKGSPYTLTVDALRISVDMAELIRIADMTEALTASRSYNKKGFSKPRALRIILEEVRIGKIDPRIAFLWIDDEIKQIEAEDMDLDFEDQRDIAIIKNELESIRNKIGNDPFALQAA